MVEASPFEHRRLLGHDRYDCAMEREWFERHEPWLWEQLASGTTRWADEPAFIVDSALAWLFARARGPHPSWEELDVREFLLEGIALGGLPACHGPRDALLGLGEFIAWMGDNGKLEPASATRLLREMDACGDRFLALLGDGGSEEMAEGPQARIAPADHQDQGRLVYAENPWFPVIRHEEMRQPITGYS